MSAKRRLVICLDGTWNQQDDGANVLHHFSIITPDGATTRSVSVAQQKHYLPGVGTGVLDRISGGAFGFGLEKNVRAANDWLVECFQEGRHRGGRPLHLRIQPRRLHSPVAGRLHRHLRSAPTPCAAVSQPALARLLPDRPPARAAPHTLWDGFDTKPGIRRISDVVVGPWRVEWYERTRADVSRAAGRDTGDDRVPGQLRDDLNPSERLLVRWSRRVKITYLGVYDTVGALGLDALAFPGLRSRLALHHNMRPTTIVQSCRHAFALDEHRSNFRHTPFKAYMGHGRRWPDRGPTPSRRR